MTSVTRADLMARYGLGRSTLEKWFRERAANGHPEPDGSLGNRLTWDADVWHAWYTAREAAPAVPEGLLSRDGLAGRHGLSRHALKELWADREANGHPEPALVQGKALYWDAQEWASWHSALLLSSAASGKGTASDADLITLAEAGRLLGLASGSVTVYASRPPKGWPSPVTEEPLRGGRTRRLYRRGDVLAYRDAKRRDPGGRA
ncbi:hypothetical protein LO762_15255 [Actinocorallia sp. API 0066]|uniref:hypothetical protein n=1 Tax=Actinocorallia sp. API 0066 TaxID=2896846 RepID=UPI001E63D670|nr:hypothetical protein [Actinocorallia sp. API 0066]MCD0450537.1 hypothetical protein [Actinocorallia sp. API 0066]